MTSWWYSGCWVCFKREPGLSIICEACLAALEPIVLEHACRMCKAPLVLSQICGECLHDPWYFDHLESPFYYNAMAKYLLHHLKFYRQLLLLPTLSHLLIMHLENYFREAQPELIVPVPLHRLRIFRRGFNQAHELAKRVGHAYGIKVDGSVVQKVKAGKAQARLSADARQQNLKASFKVCLQRPLKHILIVDDVFTTGATVNALAREFKKAGVPRVDVVSLFRARI